jgi:hypothetical protein
MNDRSNKNDGVPMIGDFSDRVIPLGKGMPPEAVAATSSRSRVEGAELVVVASQEAIPLPAPQGGAVNSSPDSRNGELQHANATLGGWRRLIKRIWSLFASSD